ncbi:MAG: YfhO family protein [Thermoanaerobaculia bacterium]
MAISLGLAGLLLLAALALRGLGRLLDGRLPWRVALVGGWLLPLLILFPWLSGSTLLVPSEGVPESVLAAKPLAQTDFYSQEINDGFLQLLPWELEVRRALAAGRLPFWSDLVDGASSPRSNLHTGPLSPIAAAARPWGIQYFFLFTVALKIAVAFAGTWLLARRLGASRLGSWVAAAGFAVGGGVIAWSIFPHATVAAWAPWLVLAALALARRPNGRVFAMASVLAAVVLLSGQPEVALGAFGLAGLVGLAFAGRRRRSWRVAALLIAMMILGLALAAVEVAPFSLTMWASQRATEHLERPLLRQPWLPLEPRSWFPYNFARFLLAPLGPEVFGRPYQEPCRGPLNWVLAEVGYGGLAVLAGLALALLQRKNRRLGLLLGVGGLGLLLGAEFAPLRLLVMSLPLFKLVEHTRWVPVAALCLCLAGGLGWSRASGKRGWLLLLPVAALSGWLSPTVLTAAGWLLLLGALGFARRRWQLALVLLALGLDLVPWARAMLPKARVASFYPRSPLIEHISQELAGSTFRALGNDFLLYPNLLPAYGIPDPRSQNPLVPQARVTSLAAGLGFEPSTERYFAPVKTADHPFAEFLGVRVVLSNDFLPPLRLEPLAWRLPPPFRAYLNPRALPRYFLAAGAQPVAASELRAWISRMRDARVVAVPAAAEPQLAGLGGSSGEPVEIRLLEPGRVRLRVPGTGRRLLASSVPGPEGWQAVAGGRRLPTLAVNGAYLGVVVPSGVAEVELDYTPPGLWLGLTISCAAALALAAIARSGERLRAWL